MLDAEVAGLEGNGSMHPLSPEMHRGYIDLLCPDSISVSNILEFVPSWGMPGLYIV